eukprot:1161379-Prymnesium_polylepis.1
MATADDASVAEHKRLFTESILTKLGEMKDQIERSQFLSEEKFGEIAECVETWPTLSTQERKQSQWTQGYAWAKKYSVISIGESKVLVFREKEADEATDAGAQQPPLQPALDQAARVAHQGKVFEDLLGVHVAGGHCKSKGFRDAVKQKFGKTVPQWVQAILLETCPTCVRRLPRKPTSAGHKPIPTVGLGSRGQGDLIDFQSCPDGQFKFVLNYQDHGIKLYDNIALTSKRNSAIAFALLDIFTRIGAPAILQTDNAREFSGAAGKGVKLTEEARRAPPSRGQ